MRFPAFLKEGGTIGFPAPSFGCASEPYRSAFLNAQKILNEKGFGTVPGPNAYAGDGIGISSSPCSCGEELTQMMLADDTQALISCGGGELMCEILDHVDFDAVAGAAPKWFMGYSDNTNFTFLLATLCDTASIYGPCAGTFGMEPWHPAVEDALDLLQGKKMTLHGYDGYEKESLKDEEHPLLPYNITQKRQFRLWRPGEGYTEGEARLSGRLLGGCMDCLVNLTGTGYDRVSRFAEKYKEDGILWFLEACDLNVFGIRRALWNMKHAGWFENASGFLIGRPLCMGEEMMGLDQYDAVTAVLGDLGVPILMDLDIGHLPPMMPVMTGALAEVSLQGQELAVTYECK